MNTVSGLILNMQIKEKRKGGERITLMGSVEFRGEDITSMPAYERVRRGIVLCRERHPIFPGKRRGGEPQDRRVSQPARAIGTT